MAAVNLPTTVVRGQYYLASWFNAIGKFVNSVGFAGDNDGKPQIPISLDVPFSLELPGSVQAKALAGGATYTVPAGKLLLVRKLFHAVSVTDSITPSGQSAINIATSAVQKSMNTGIVLGAGDAITLGISSGGLGILVNLPSLPSAPTRTFNAVTSGAPYQVAAGKVLLLTDAFMGAGAGAAFVTIDGVNSFTTAEITSDLYGGRIGVVATAGQMIGASTGSAYIFGLLYNA